MKRANNVYIVGSGIASLAAAVYLIKHKVVPPECVTIFESGDCLGGAMGASMVDVPPDSAYPNRPSRAYVLPAIRLLEEHYACAQDLFERFPSVTDASKTIAEDAIDFNSERPYYDRTRLLNSEGEVVPGMGVSLADAEKAAELMLLRDEEFCDGLAMDDKKLGFSDQFFESQFFLAWTTMMGPLRKHSAIEFKRYFQRFLHVVPHFDSMANVWRMRLNQDDGVVRPILAWLKAEGVDAEGKMLAHGVNLRPNTVVKAVRFAPDRDGVRAESITFKHGDDPEETLPLEENDYVFVTLGSQTANQSAGSMAKPPDPVSAPEKAWALWSQIRDDAAGLKRFDFGDPDPFFAPKPEPGEPPDPYLGTWVTFTFTANKPIFLDLLSALTKNKSWEQGIVTLIDSPWMLSVVPFPKPHFLGQEEGSWTWWGFSLCHDKAEKPNRRGDCVKKPVTECSGADILEETIGQLGFGDYRTEILESTVCIPCLLPHVGSVWMKRRQFSRPKVVPDGARNFAFLGQFCEMPGDTMFTMEYSVRSAQAAIERLFGGPRPPAVYQGQNDPIAIGAAMARFGSDYLIH